MVKPTQDQFCGALLGLALGDAMGAPLEGGVLERIIWRLIGNTRAGKSRWTDDTQMSLDLVETILATGKVDQTELARRFAESYRWSRGYGPGTAKTLKKIAKGMDWRQASRVVYPRGSWGNGAAMRAPVIGLYYFNDRVGLEAAAQQSAVVTHGHPLGIAGAYLVALATAYALTEPAAHMRPLLQQEPFPEPFLQKMAIAQDWLERKYLPQPSQLRQQLGNGMSATESVVTAIFCALGFINQAFLDMLAFIQQDGGDTDTIGAIAGAIWGAKNGYEKLPRLRLGELESAEVIRTKAMALHQKALGER